MFKNGPKLKRTKESKHPDKLANKQNKDQCWYQNFRVAWDEIEQKIEKIQSQSYEKTLESLISFIRNSSTDDLNLQTAVLLTGVNQTDHLKQFDSLALKIVNNCYSITSILRSRDCPNVKAAIECLVGGFVNDNSDEEDNKVRLKKKQQTLPVLKAWFESEYENMKKPKLVVMIADFEQFNPLVIQEVIGILTSYGNRLPFVLIIGVATAFQAIHNVLPFHITSKITANIFQAESSTSMLNRILDEVILTHHSPFFLSGKSFKILMDIFLFYDYSINSFIQGFKIFMLEQFTSSAGNCIYLGNGELSINEITRLTHEDCENIRRSCLSFRKYVESEEDPQLRIDLITNDEVFKMKIEGRFKRVYRYFYQFLCCLRMLSVLIEDLPRNNLGKLPRELYPICAASDITSLEEYQECFKLLRFSSKDKFLAKLDKVMIILETYVDDEKVSNAIRKNLKLILKKIGEFHESISSAGMTPEKQEEKKPTTPKNEINRKGVMGRQEMLEKLKESAKNNPNRVVIEYERQLCNCIDYLNGVFEQYLCPFSKAPPLNELIIFSDCSTVRRQIMGTPRGSVHNALSNPQHYIQCSCCVMKEEQLLPTLPDISIAYKLHLECNKFINLFDWLQAFAMVIKNDHDDDNEEISPEIQARFARATAELQFLGLIKQAKHKTDHVMRLTW